MNTDPVLRWRVFAPRPDAPRGWYILAAIPGERFMAPSECAEFVRLTGLAAGRETLRISAVYADRIDVTEFPAVSGERAA